MTFKELRASLTPASGNEWESHDGLLRLELIAEYPKPHGRAREWKATLSLARLHKDIGVLWNRLVVEETSRKDALDALQRITDKCPEEFGLTL